MRSGHSLAGQNWRESNVRQDVVYRHFYRLSGFEALGVAAHRRADLNGEVLRCRGSAGKK